MKSDLTNRKFGRLTVVRPVPPAGRNGRWWLCACECGQQVERATSKLQDKHNQNSSCGCAKRDSIAKASRAAWEVTTKFRHPLKKKLSWMIQNMIRRCHKPGSRRYERYGGRGISVCSEWRENRTAFFEWATANGFGPGMSIDRIDFNGNYCPENCRFIPLERQQVNTSRNRFIEFGGERMTVSDWARKLGVRQQAIHHRLARGWTIERMITQKFRGMEVA